MGRLRWAIVGAGKISHDFVTALQIFPESHAVAAVGSGSKENAEKFAKDHNIPKFYEGYEEIARNSDVDVVYIGNLNTQHYSTAKLMLNNGKPVLCEKPFTMNEKQTKELVNIARSKNIFLMEAVWSRCFPAYQKIKDLIEADAIGDIKFVSVTFGFDLQDKERVTDKKYGGGAILDIGVYCLQFQQFIYRDLKRTSMEITGSLTKQGVDGTTAALIGYEDGKLASIACSSEAKMPNEGVIVGTKGTIRVPNFWCPTQVVTEQETFKFELPVSEVPFVHLNSAGLSYEAQEVKRCLDNGEKESPKMPLHESIELAKLMDTMRKNVGLVFPEDSLY